ncbi:hypothetical protein [Paraburkholderia sp.]|uniref:hypothetical protein n=1 Tax=Paraburkholderia sp. TaxID=1926495 RepID=UPI0025D103D5|nr:hypothetical protein [Paraburkholderia sp.]
MDTALYRAVSRRAEHAHAGYRIITIMYLHTCCAIVRDLRLGALRRCKAGARAASRFMRHIMSSVMRVKSLNQAAPVFHRAFVAGACLRERCARIVRVRVFSISRGRAPGSFPFDNDNAPLRPARCELPIAITCLP